MATSSASGAMGEEESKRAHDDDEYELLRRAGWKALFGFTTKRHLPIAFAASFMAVVAALAVPALAIMYGLIFRQFTDYGAGKISSSELLSHTSKYCTWMTGFTALCWLACNIFFGLFVAFGELQARSARERIFNVLLSKDMAWYDTRDGGMAAFLPTIQMQIRDLQLSVAQPLGEAIFCLVQALAALGVALYFSWNLTMITICTVPLIFFVMSVLSRRMTKRLHEQAGQLQQALKCLTGALQNIEAVKCFNGERYELHRFIAAITRAASVFNRQANVRSSQIAIMQFFTLSIFVQGFWYGSHLVITGQKNAGQVITTIYAALMTVQAITTFLPQLIILQKGKVAGARLRMLLEQIRKDNSGPEIQGSQKPDHYSGNVQFQRVTFTYPTRPDQPALRDASIFFPAGETTFVIGRSGSGKSTLGQLLVRFYEPSSGQILIDDTPLGTLDARWLRDNVTLVEQHSVLFNETIRRNITLAKKDEPVTELAVTQMVEFALLEQMIQDLPSGLDTMVGNRGGSVSGGQRQRMALARARLRDTPVLVLDESTSALDYVTRAAVLQGIREWRRGKTTIVITHDISQILPEDFVYVLDNSRVVQEGYRRTLEAKLGSAFHTFLASVQEEHTKAVTEPKGRKLSLDDTDETMNLYAASWGVDTHRRSTIFDNSFLSPIFSPGRNSILVAGSLSECRRSSVVQLELGRSSPLPLKQPPNSQRTSYDPTGTGYESGSLRTIGGDADRCSSIESVPHPLTSVQAEEPVHLDTSIGLSFREKWRQKKVRFRRRNWGKEISTSNPGSLSLFQIVRTVWPALPARSRLALVGAALFACIHAAATPTFAFIFARLLSTFYAAAEQRKMALIYALSILGVAVIDGIASYCFHFLFDVSAQSWTNVLKAEAMRRILLQPREFFDRESNSVSRIAECLDHFAEEARNLPGRFVGIALVAVAMVTIAIIWSMISCWKLTLVSLSMGPVLYLITACYNVISHRWETASNEADEGIGEVLHETFVNIRTVRCLVLEEHFRTKYRESITEALKVGLKRAIYTGSIHGLNYASLYFVTVFLFWFGALIVSRGEFATTDIIQVFTILLFSLNHVNYLGNYIPQINIARDAGSRLLRLATLPQDSHERRGTIQVQTAGEVVLDKVTFAYPTRKEQAVLRDVSFRIAKGSCTAIVGSSGSGKSTIAALLLKLYETQSLPVFGPPDFLVSGRDVKTLHTASLRSRMAMVSQSPVIFSGTIAENISYGLAPSSSRASMESIRRAARATGIAEFIDSLPQGYSTVIGEGGSGLSGGQAQRVAIARALVRDPDILILDEATSALDAESAGIIRDTIQRLVEGKGGARDGDMTVIIITHAREMMAIAEYIVMLDKGRVVEEGKYEELVRNRHGAFGRLLRGEQGEG
ncbi:P-loop containing nucleoside triphosphate hydrolase protein [Amniculicola lignicola CBS 123094]|uniref:P-loop containing nucleoside triphosphate hydrolase protein n=1 Tax=Amniculicola lignicola CBS 123094 TaxID=1392246 RepID=A0A6A5WUL6_9PLEO|nr:P-loop containing nucleoside triphosphate hydrolase protein [Amniculicola lignicola CBS 123094]